MKLPVNLLKTKTGVKVAAILLIVTFMIITFTSMTMGAPGVTYGDVNNDGDIDVRDVVLVMQYIIGLRNLTDDQLKAADVNFDGAVNVQDATLIMQHVLEIKELAVPVESVNEVEISVPYGTLVDSIDFPDTVTAILHDESEEEVDIEWETTSEPAYNSQSPDDYTFKGDLVDLPAGIANPDEIQAVAVVTVEKINVPEYRSPTPTPDPDVYTLSLVAEPLQGGNLTGGGDYEAGTEIAIMAEEAPTYEFINWTRNDSVVSALESFIYTMPANDVTLVANFEQRENSTYQFSFDFPENIAPGEYVYTDVTFANVLEGSLGYDDVRFAVEADGPEGSVVSFSAYDTEEDTTYDFVNSGYYGPQEGFDIPAVYSDTTSWQINFSEMGEYTITFSLIEAPEGEIVADTTDSVTVIVGEVNHITGVEELDDIEGVLEGTPEGELPLPDDVEVELSDGTYITVDVDWASDNYDETPGTYAFTGTLENLPEGVSNPDQLTASITVIVIANYELSLRTNIIAVNSNAEIMLKNNTDAELQFDRLNIRPDTGDDWEYDATTTTSTIPAGEKVVIYEREYTDVGTYILSASVVNDGVTILSEDFDLNVTDELYSLTFTVSDQDGVAVENATTTILGWEEATDSNGQAIFTDLPADTYEYIVEKTDWYSEEGTVVIVDDNVTEDVTLTPYATVTVEVKDGDPVEGASVMLGQEGSKLSSPLGEAVFANVESGEYTIKVTMDGYETYEQEVTVGRVNVKFPVTLESSD